MTKFITTSFVLVLIVVAFLNGAYSVDEGEGRGNNKMGNDDPNLYKSEKFGPTIDCAILLYNCLASPIPFVPNPACLLYNQFCAQKPPTPSTLP
ncbi:hypothetical protein MtrunA17_Chr8g0339791 [Medicago truncatula]|uniref:RALF-like protein n=1 Tax=Medicago truncatula TaxID=3880 RepID=A0A072TXB4_MEDTR|nr:RALF-like protein [Medicago truncatula]RHN39059.1 hypothetical protein MtrunA17_Chr8g0339791 [Medicago truncatula]